MSIKETYNLHVAKEPAPVELIHPETGTDIGSWTYLVSHTKTNEPLSRKKSVILNEVFDFAARKVLTLDTNDIIQKIDDFDDKHRQQDIEKAYQWLKSNHPNWYFTK